MFTRWKLKSFIVFILEKVYPYEGTILDAVYSNREAAERHKEAFNRVNDSDVVYARVIVRPLFDDVIIREQSINGDIVGSRPTGGGFDPLCSHLWNLKNMLNMKVEYTLEES